MVEEHSGEQGLFGKVQPTMEIAEQTRAKAELDQFIATDMPTMLGDSSVMDELDSEIRSITDSEANNKARAKNLKTRINSQ